MEKHAQHRVPVEEMYLKSSLKRHLEPAPLRIRAVTTHGVPGEPAEEPAEEPVEEPVEEPLEEPVGEPLEEPVESRLRELSARAAVCAPSQKWQAQKHRLLAGAQSEQVFSYSTKRERGI